LRRHSHLGQLIHNSSLTERTKDVGVPDVFCFCGICVGGPPFRQLRRRAGKSSKQASCYTMANVSFPKPPISSNIKACSYYVLDEWCHH
jgi:hypothetical protein